MNLGGIWREFSQDEFIRWESGILAARIHPARSRRTNSSGYEFIKWDLLNSRRTNSSTEKWWIRSIETYLPRIMFQLNESTISQLTNLSGYEIIKWDLLNSRRTNSSRENWPKEEDNSVARHPPVRSRTIRLCMVSLLNPTRTLKLLAVREKCSLVTCKMHYLQATAFATDLSRIRGCEDLCIRGPQTSCVVKQGWW